MARTIVITEKELRLQCELKDFKKETVALKLATDEKKTLKRHLDSVNNHLKIMKSGKDGLTSELASANEHLKVINTKMVALESELENKVSPGI